MIYKDDLVSDFWSLSYQPDLAVEYFFVFVAYLVILIGIVFGFKYSPSLLCLLSNMRSFASWFVHSLPHSYPTTSMVNKVNFPHSPPSYMDINPYHKGPKNQGVEGTNLGPKPTFVDDMIMEEVRYLIHQAADNSFLPTSVLVNNSNIIKETISFKKNRRLLHSP